MEAKHTEGQTGFVWTRGYSHVWILSVYCVWAIDGVDPIRWISFKMKIRSFLLDHIWHFVFWVCVCVWFSPTVCCCCCDSFTECNGMERQLVTFLVCAITHNLSKIFLLTVRFCDVDICDWISWKFRALAIYSWVASSRFYLYFLLSFSLFPLSWIFNRLIQKHTQRISHRLFVTFWWQSLQHTHILSHTAHSTQMHAIN